MSEHIAFIGLGSNLGNRMAHLAAARAALAKVLTIERASSIYETEPVDVQNQPWFLNQVIMGSCALSPFDLLNACLAIEAQQGRERKTLKGPRTLDVDVLLYNDLVLDAERDGHQLTIPHPRLHLRKFVLMPLCELVPQLRHPALDKTVEELLSAVDDRAVIRLYPFSESTENG